MPVDGDIVLNAALNTKNVENSIDGLKNLIKKSFSTIIKYGFGVRSLYFLFRKLRKQLIDGFGNLAQVSQPFNSAVSDMKNALAGLKSSFASAFAPIIQYVAPAITTFINLLANAVDAVGKFIAALTGQKTYIKYVATQQDYAQSVSNTADSANSASDALDSASKSAKKYQRTIAGFDDVEILKEPTDSSSSNGTGGTGGTGSVSPIAGITESSISDVFTDFADKLKEAWKNADFTEIGTIIGTKLNNALKKIPWKNIKETLKNVAKSIATFLNGFLETPELFSTIGVTIAEAINSAFEFVNSFVSNFHWSSLGIAIKTLIINAINNLDWPTIESACTGIASGIATAINSALANPMFWITMFGALAKMINLAIAMLRVFVLTIDLTAIASGIAMGINTAIAKINWYEFGKTFATLANKLFYALAEFFGTVNWRRLGSSVVTAIAGFFTDFDWKAVGTTLTSLGQALFDFLDGAFDEIDWETLPTYITDAVDDFLTGFDWEDLINRTIGLITDAVDGLIEMLSGSDKKGEDSPIVKALNALKESIGQIDSETFKDLAEAIKRLVEAMKPITEGFGAGLIAFLSKAIDLGVSVLTALGQALDDIADALEEMDPDVLEKVGTALGIIVGAFVTLNTVHGIVSGLAGIISGIGSAATVAAGPISSIGSAIAGITLPALGATVGLAGLFAILNTETVGESQEDLEALHTTISKVDFAIGELGLKYGWTKEQMDAITEPMRNISETDGPAVQQAFKDIEKNIEDAGGSTDEFKTALNDVASHGITGTAFTNISNYLGEISKSAKDADTDTTGLSDAFGLFSAPNFSAILKLALLKGAVDALGSSGKLSEQDTAKLQKTLDKYDSKPTEENMGKIQKAMEDAGVSAGDLNAAYIDAVKTLPKELKPEYNKVARSVSTNNANIKSKMEDGGKDTLQGFMDGVDDKKEDVQTKMKDVANDDVVETFDKTAGINSPSTVMKLRGQYLMDGLKEGIQSKQTILTSLVTKIVSSMNTAIGGFYKSFETSGLTLMTKLHTGIKNKSDALVKLVAQLASNMRTSFYSINWRITGYNAAVGLYNGFVSLNGKLQQMVYQVASNMLRAAERAFNIGSPSKEFAWIGEMTMLGLANGITDNEKHPIDAITDITDDMEDAAENADLGVTFNTKLSELLDAFDLILDQFSDIIIERFDGLIGSLAMLNNPAFAGIPSIVQGKVAPYSFNSTANSAASQIESLKSAINEINDNRVTREDINDIVQTALRNIPIELYIGDEQLARHANAGNAKLTRRFS